MSDPTNMSPAEMRAKLVASYRESYRRAQIEMTDAEIERQVISDCHLVDRARELGELSNPGKPANDNVDLSKPHAPARPDLLAQAQAETNTRLNPEGNTRVRPDHLYANPFAVSERWAYACARIKRITEGAGGAANLSAGLSNAAVPRLAREYAELWSHYMTKDKPAPSSGNDKNPFRGLSPKDAARMFIRKVEDICDKSTGMLGSWYVK